MRGSKFLAHNRRVAILAVLGFLGGIALLFGGAVSAMTWLGVLGFVVMLGAAYVFVTAWRRGIGQGEEGGDEPAAAEAVGLVRRPARGALAAPPGRRRALAHSRG